MLSLLCLSVLPSPDLVLSPVAGGFKHPLDLSSPPGDAHRLFVSEQGGKIWIIKDGTRLPEPFLDLSALSTPWGHRDYTEQGLLGLAFHPRYAANGRFFVHYTDLNGDTALAEYRVSQENPDKAHAQAVKIVLTQKQPYENHNGGQIAFGPDGFLYMALGDGGAGGDPHGNGQNGATLLGKILRLDLDHGDPYGIPPGNPFRRRKNFRPEIWDLGLRNPWRFSFDPANGDLYIADVGQNAWEELDFEPRTGKGGKNYGWVTMEGLTCYKADSCDRRGLTPPIFVYSHENGCSITGGYVYRGSKIPSLRGIYIFGDYCQARFWAVKAAGGTKAEVEEWTNRLNPDKRALENISSFGLDGNLELYVADYDRGRILRLEPKP